MWQVGGQVLGGAFAILVLSGTMSGEPPAATMASRARQFLHTLDASQRSKAQLPFDTDERFNWHFVPRPRAGLSLKQMSSRSVMPPSRCSMPG